MDLPGPRVVWLGMLGYVIYNDAFYLFGAAGSLAVTTAAATVLLLARPQRRVTSIPGSSRTTDGQDPT